MQYYSSIVNTVRARYREDHHRYRKAAADGAAADEREDHPWSNDVHGSTDQ